MHQKFERLLLRLLRHSCMSKRGLAASTLWKAVKLPADLALQVTQSAATKAHKQKLEKLASSDSDDSNEAASLPCAAGRG